jgi:ecotin
MNSKFLVSVVLVALTANASAGGHKDELEPYPAAEPGFVRMVFNLPEVANESDRKVEIMVGKTMMVDCNRHGFGGDLEQGVAQGWGYSYFVLADVQGPMSTMMACPPEEEKIESFVRVQGEGYIQAYNSKLPMVIYVPEGFSVRYRIWEAREAIGNAEAR